MGSVLNIGINDNVVQRIITITGGNIRFAMDLYIHFLQLFGVYIMNIPRHEFDDIIKQEMIESSATCKSDLTGDSLVNIVGKFKKLGQFPEDAFTQLKMVISAIYKHWYAKK
jgi:pyruvate,orthophosphate dikinase